MTTQPDPGLRPAPTARRWSRAPWPSTGSGRRTPATPCCRCCRTSSRGWSRAGCAAARAWSAGAAPWSSPRRVPHRFADAEAWWRDVVASAVVRDEVGLPGTGPVAFGSVSYAADSPCRGHARRARGRRRLPRRQVVGDHDRRRPPCPPPPDLQRPGAAARARGRHVRRRRPVSRAVGGPGLRGGRAHHRRRARQGGAGPRPAACSAGEPIDPRWLLQRLAERYDTTWVFAVDGLVGATPEMLVRLEKGLVTSRVLAGTIRRTGDDAHDLALAASLARSSKDLEEHEYAVRSVADALRPHCSSMNVPESPFVLHLSPTSCTSPPTSPASSPTPRPRWRWPRRCTPPRRCAAPRPRWPTRSSPSSRGWTAAGMPGRSAGWTRPVTASGASPCAAAPSSPADPRAMRLFAGCGIVAGSDPESEVAESDAKLVPMRDALSGA